jgi:MraZ protein
VVICGKIFLFLLGIDTKRFEVNSIIGTYECKVDAKGRLLLPAPLKKQLASSLQEGFVLKRSVFQPCLELYPMAEWNLLMNKVNKLNRFVKKNNDFIRRFTAGVKVVEIDNLGRLLIPKDLVVFASVKKDLVLSSAVNIVEIWDKDLYEKSIDDATVDFADLAEDVMGNVNDDDNGIS